MLSSASTSDKMAVDAARPANASTGSQDFPPAENQGKKPAKPKSAKQARPKKQKKAGDDDDQYETAKEKKARKKQENEEKASARKKKRPSKLVVLHLKNKQTPPEFEKLELECSPEVFWLRVQLREFLLRFDKICRVSSRHLAALNDLLSPWTDGLYKGVISALFKVLNYDRSPLFPQAQDFAAQIDSMASDSYHLWEVLYEFLVQSDPYSYKATELDGEEYRLELVRRLMVLTTGTEVIRSTVSADHEQIQVLKREATEQVKKHETMLSESKEKAGEDEEKLVNMEKSIADKIFKTEQTMHSQLRKYNLRTAPLGVDNHKNVYWGLQHKGKDNVWGGSVICQMTALPRTSTTEDAEPATHTSSEEDSASQKPTLYLVSGQENLHQLAAWIRGQVGPKRAHLANEIETRALYMD